MGRSTIYVKSKIAYLNGPHTPEGLNLYVSK